MKPETTRDQMATILKNLRGFIVFIKNEEAGLYQRFKNDTKVSWGDIKTLTMLYEMVDDLVYDIRERLHGQDRRRKK